MAEDLSEPKLPSGFVAFEDQGGEPDLPPGFTPVKKKDSSVAVDNGGGSSPFGSNPFLNSLTKVDPVPNNDSARFPYTNNTRDYYAESKSAVRKELQARKNKPSTPAETENIDAPDEQGYASQIGESLFERGLARLYGMVAKTPSFLYRTASIPQNAIADLTGWESVRPMTPEQITETTGINNKVADYYDNIAAESQKRITQRYDKSVTEYLGAGDWSNAAKLAGNQIAESIPTTLGIALTRGAGASTGATVIGGGAVFGAGKYNDIKDAPVPENVKVFNSVLTGLSEGVFENFGTGKIVDAGLDILKKQGKEAGYEFVQSSISGVMKSAMKKMYLLNSTIIEGIEEAATQFTENLIDRESGVRKVDDLTAGVLDSFIIGAGSGFAMSAPIEAYSRITNPVKKAVVQADANSNQSLAEDLNNPDVPVAVKGSLLKQYMENNERINNEIEQNDDRLNRLSPAESTRAEGLLLEINQLDELINNSNVSSEAKVLAAKKQESLYGSLNEIIGTDPEVVDTKTQIQRQNEIDTRVAEFQTKFPERNIDPMEDLPASVVRTFDRVDNDVPTDIVAINEASAWLYDKYKAFTAMKASDTRQLTIDQIESVQTQLGEDIAQLENFKSKYYGDGEQQQPGVATETAPGIQTETSQVQPEASPVVSPIEGETTTGGQITREQSIPVTNSSEVNVDDTIDLVNGRVGTVTKVEGNRISMILENGSKFMGTPDMVEMSVRRQVQADAAPEVIQENQQDIAERNADQATIENAQPAESPTVLRNVEFNNPDLGNISVSELSDGTFDATFEDGNTENYSRGDVQSVVGFNPDVNLENEFEARLSAATDPNEIAAIYDEEVTKLSDTGSKESAIANYDPKTTQEEFARVADGNNMNQEIRLQYTGVGNNRAAIPLDTQAQEINDLYFNGQDVVTPADITDFMQSYPNGSASYTTQSGQPSLRAINARYNEVTGRNLRKDTARNLAQKYNKSIEEANAAIDAAEGGTNIEEIIDRDLEFADGFTTPAELANTWQKDLTQYREDPSNEFNIWYPAFNGQPITDDQFNTVQNLINERATQQTGSGTGNEGPVSGSNTGDATSASDNTNGETGADTSAGDGSQTVTLANKIRALKTKPGQLYGGVIGVPIAVYDGALETLATAIEAGQAVAQAIQRAVDHIKANSDNDNDYEIEAALREDLELNDIATGEPVPPTRDADETIPQFALRLAQYRQAFMPNLANNGNLNGNNSNPQTQAFGNNWVLPEERKREKLVRKNVDFLNRLEVAENAIKEAGGIISSDESAYTQFQLLGAKTGKKIDDVMERVVFSNVKNKKSLFQKIKDSGLTISELGLFTYAQHAPERNAYVAELRQNNLDAEIARLDASKKKKIANGQSTSYEDNRISLLNRGKLPKFELLPDAGSGMSNQEAQDILDQFDAEKKTQLLTDFAEQYRNEITREELAMQLQNGLISDAEYQNITNRYKFYVPLQVEEYVKKGFASSIKNILRTRKTLNRTVGSAARTFNERVNPVLYGVVQFEKSSIESGKNEWLTTLKNLVINNPNDEVWAVSKPQYAAEYNKDGSVKALKEITPKKIIDQSVKAFDNGKPYYIQIKDETLRRAITQSGVIKGVHALNVVNDWLRGVNTLYNPNFVLENFIRDPQEAAFQLSGKAKGIKTKFFKNIPGAFRGIFNHHKGDRSSEWAQTYEEYLNAGAKISFAQYTSDIDKLNIVAQNLERIGEKGGSVTQVMRGAKDWFENISSVIELTTRVAAFKAAKDSGMEVSEAANLSRNVTVDFNKKGELTGLTNSLYLFANAGTQGGFNMVKKVLTSKSGAKFMGAYVMAGFTAAMFNSMLGANDDDSEEEKVKNNYWNLPEYQRSTSLVLKNPIGDGFFKIPLGRALSVPFYAGSELFGVLTGKVKSGEALKNVGLGAINTYNPLGSSQDILQVLSPTVTDPIVQIATNKNAFGSPIIKENKYGTKKPASQLYFKNTNEFSIAFTGWLNKATGGSIAEAGAIDISPNRIDWAAQTVGGGAANFIKNNLLGFTTDITKGDMDEAVKDAPILGRFYTTSKPVSALGTVYNTLEKSGTTKLTPEDREEFLQTLKLARREKEIDGKDVKRYRNILNKNQKRIDLAKKHPEWDEEKLDRYFKRD